MQTSSEIRQIDQQIRLLLLSAEDVPEEAFALRKKRNALLPIESLPTEIFIEILRSAVQTRVSPSLELAKLLNVSSWWWSVITNCPSLWSTITFGCPSSSTAIQRSKSALIAIQILSRNPDGFNEMREFLTTLVEPHCRRCRSLTFDGHRFHFRFVQRSLTGPFLSLAKLAISAHGPQIFLVDIPISAPLTDLSLKGASPRRDVTLPSSLQSLTFQAMGGPRAPTASALLTMLGQCPRLHTLHLHDITPNGIEEDDAPRPAQTSISLQNLHTLILKDLPDDYVTTLLQNIQVPRLTKCFLELKTHYQADAIKVLFPDEQDLSNPLPFFLRNTPDPELRAALWPHKIWARRRTGSHYLELIIRFPEPAPNLDVGLRLLRSYTAKASDVHLRVYGKLENPLQLDAIPNLTKLVITEADTTKLIIDHLLPTETAARRLSCPRLELLHSGTWWDQEDVNTLVKSRQSSEKGFPELKVLWGPEST